MSSNMKKWLSLISTLAIAFVMCLIGISVFSANTYAAEGEPDLVVTYGGQSTSFYYDKTGDQLYVLDGENKVFVPNVGEEQPLTYSAVNNKGNADSVEGAYGPKLLDIFTAAGINYANFGNQTVTFAGADNKDPRVFAWGDLFGTRYYYPNAKDRPSPDNGAAVSGTEADDPVEVPVIINFNSDAAFQSSFGQISPSERNKPFFCKNMVGKDKITPKITIEDVASFTPFENNAVPTTAVDATVEVGDTIDFNDVPATGFLYYTTDGTEPTQSSAIYNYNAKDHINAPVKVDKDGSFTIKTKVFGFLNTPSETKTFTFNVKTPDLLVSYGDSITPFYYDEDADQLYTLNGGNKDYVDNTASKDAPLTYSAVNNKGNADNVTGAYGPALLDIFAAAGIDCSGFEKQTVTFAGADKKDPRVLAWGDLFGQKRYYYPNAKDRPSPDNGAAVSGKEAADPVEVPVIINFNIDAGFQSSFGQVSPSERNKPYFCKNMVKKGKIIPEITIEDVDAFTPFENAIEPTIASGSKVVVGNEINFSNLPQEGFVYYTTDGSEPTQSSAIYNWNAKDGISTPIKVEKEGALTIKTKVFGYLNQPSQTKTFTYVAPFDLAKVGTMTLSKSKVTAGAAAPVVTVVAEGKTLKVNTDYTLSVGNTKKVGTISAKVTGKELYKGTLTKSFKVIPAKAKINKAIAGKKKVTVMIKSQKASGVTKYQIKYKLKTAKKWKTTTTKSTKKVIKKLKKGKKYNIKVRAYGKTGYGAYSAVKTVKIK